MTVVTRNTGGSLLTDLLIARGVERIFSVSGGPLNPIYHATLERPLQVIHTRHEAAAAFMAEGTSRVTRTPGVCVVTLGPGVTNTLSAALTANRAGVPLLILGGQSPVSVLDKQAIMSFDPLPVVAPLMKYAARVLDPDRIEEYLDTAWRAMLAGRPGPAFLEIPINVLAGPAPQPAAATHQGAGSGPAIHSADATDLKRMITESRRPLLIAGDDIHWTSAESLLGNVVDRIGAPFVTLRLGRGAISEQHPRCAGVGYLGSNPALRYALTSADLVIILGHDVEADLGYGASIQNRATIVHVHPDAAVVGRYLTADLEIIASANSVLEAIASVEPPNIDEVWCEEVIGRWRAELDRIKHLSRKEGEGVHPARLTSLLAEATPPETTFVTSHGNIDFWADMVLQLEPPQQYLRAGQSGALGAEIPFGVAAKMASPDRTVVVIVGDGGFAFHGFELETAARYNAPIVVIIYDDQKWGAIALPQLRAYNTEIEMDLPRRSWSAVAEAIGGHGEYADNEHEVIPAIHRALKANRPAVVQVNVRTSLSPYIAFESS